uniref:Uncharacterized protein n=1 Tax=Arundo donax TaxID=35708 RepID=A0A0A9HWU3_ARUDO
MHVTHDITHINHFQTIILVSSAYIVILGLEAPATPLRWRPRYENEP